MEHSIIICALHIIFNKREHIWWVGGQRGVENGSKHLIQGLVHK